MNKVYEKHCKGCSSDLTLAEYKALVAKAEQEALKKLDKEILDDKKSEEK
jgi:hypothetical protein